MYGTQSNLQVIKESGEGKQDEHGNADLSQHQNDNESMNATMRTGVDDMLNATQPDGEFPP